LSAESHGPLCFSTISYDGGVGTGSWRSRAQRDRLSSLSFSLFPSLTGVGRGPSDVRRRRRLRSPVRRTQGRSGLRRLRPIHPRSAQRLRGSRPGRRPVASGTRRRPRSRGPKQSRRRPRTQPRCGWRRARVRPLPRRCRVVPARSPQLRNHSRQPAAPRLACSLRSHIHDKPRHLHRSRGPGRSAQPQQRPPRPPGRLPLRPFPRRSLLRGSRPR
jgi:hypothetical protein